MKVTPPKFIVDNAIEGSPKIYSQSNEACVVMEYFHGEVGNLLDIGANDGETFSNSRNLLQLGWSGTLIEPSPKAFSKLLELYGTGEKTTLLNIAISDATATTTLHESGAHVLGGNDIALVSTVVPAEMNRWKDVEFNNVQVDTKRIDDAGLDKRYDFISIDCEGMDWVVLQQLNLTAMGCKCICVEHNSIMDLKLDIIGYCKQFGLETILLSNAENIIIAK